MPPKPKAAAPKQVEDDLADAANLPSINSFLFTTLYQSFKLKSRRSQIETGLSSYITGAADQPFRQTTREEIITGGRNRGILNDAEGAEIPEDQLTPTLIAKAAKAKILELSMPFMRNKRDKLNKLEEQAKAAAEEEYKKKVEENEGNTEGVEPVTPKPVVLDDTDPDLYIMIKGFPSSKEEALELSKFDYSLNGILVVTESSEFGLASKAQEGEEPPSEDDIIPTSENTAVFKTLRYFEQAKRESIKESSLRFSAVKRIEYRHQVTEEPAKNSVTEFPGTVFYPQLQKLGQKLMTFKRFKTKTKLIKLEPEIAKSHEILEEIKEKEPVRPTGSAASLEAPSRKAEEEAAEVKIEAAPEAQQGQEEVSADKGMKLFDRNLMANCPGQINEVCLSLSSLVEQVLFDLERVVNRPEQQYSPGFTMEQDSSVLSGSASPKKGTIQVASGKLHPQNTDLDNFFNNLTHQIEMQCHLQEGVMEPSGTIEVESDDGEDDYGKRHNLGSVYSAVVDELDQARSENLNARLNSGHFLEDKHLIYTENISVPGIGRHLMPEYPEKSEELRNAERTELYPFAALSHEMVERIILLKGFENMMKSKESERDWEFTNRFYQEYLNESTLRYTIIRALELDPDVATSYWAREDALLVSIYNRTPPGRIFRKRWTAPYQGMPDFENWLTHFPKSSEVKPLYDIDDSKVGLIQERVKLLYPSDESAIKISNLNIANRKIPSILVQKDNLVFGLRQGVTAWRPSQDLDRTQIGAEQAGEQPSEEQHAIGGEEENKAPDESKLNSTVEKAEEKKLKLKPGEAWFSFDNDVRMMVEMVSHRPAGPSPLLPVEIAQPECVGAATTLTTKDGLIVKYLPNGDVLQKRTTAIKEQMESAPVAGVLKEKEKGPKENARLVTGLGSIIRYLDNGNIEILHPDGNVALFRKQTNSWLVTNNKGKRRVRHVDTGREEDFQSIPCAHKTDPETLAKVMIREDNVISIAYANGSRLTIHADGTRIFKDKDSTVIEQQGYAPVRVRLDTVKQRSKTIISLGGTDALMGSDDIMERSHDGRVMVTYLFDKSEVRVFREKQKIDDFNFSDNHVLLLKRPDGAMVKVKQDGEIIIISANQRQLLNQRGRNVKYGNDNDYMFDLFGIPKERKEGIYTIEVQKGLLWTRDAEGNIFRVLADGSSHERMAVSFDLKAVADDTAPNEMSKAAIRPSSPQMAHDGTLIEEECKFLPPPKTVRDPRLFAVWKDGTGCEFFSKRQLSHYLRTQQMNKDVMRQGQETLIGAGTAYCRTFLTLVKSREDQWKQVSQLQNLEIPRIVDSVPQTVSVPKQPSKRFFLFRCLLEHIPFEGSKKEIYESDMARYQEWKEAVKKQQQEFGGAGGSNVADMSEEDKMDLEDQKNASRRIMLKVLRERRKQDPFYPPEQVKERLINQQIILNGDGRLELKAVSQRSSVSANVSEVGSQFYRQMTGGNMSVASAHHIGTEDQGSLRNATSTFHPEPRAMHSTISEVTAGDYLEKGFKKMSSIETQKFTNNSIQDNSKEGAKELDITLASLYSPEERQLMAQSTPFIANYFMSRQGQRFLKENPQDPPQEVMERPPRANDTSATQSAKPASQPRKSEGGSSAQPVFEAAKEVIGDDMEPVLPSSGANASNLPDRDNPIVELQPESGGKAHPFTGRGGMTTAKLSKETLERRMRPSVATQLEIMERHAEQEKMAIAENYHLMKSKEFDIYGGTRQQLKKPNAIKKSAVKTEINEKYIITEAITDKRMKTSSMAGRSHFNAPNVQQVRKQGQHQMILGALAKKQTFSEMIDQASLMVTAALADPLKRAFMVNPGTANFGPVCEGGVYRIEMTLKNEDIITQRLNVTQPLKGKARGVRIWAVKKGPIAPGLNEKVIVELRAPRLMEGEEQGQLVEEVKRTEKVEDEFKIITKTDNLVIPITATILPKGQYEDLKLINPNAIKVKPFGEVATSQHFQASIRKSSVAQMSATMSQNEEEVTMQEPEEQQSQK